MRYPARSLEFRQQLVATGIKSGADFAIGATTSRFVRYTYGFSMISGVRKADRMILVIATKT